MPALRLINCSHQAAEHFIATNSDIAFLMAEASRVTEELRKAVVAGG